MAIDCEMDQLRAEFSPTGMGMNIPCKVSVINEQGQVVLDTLVRPHVDDKDFADVQKEMPGFKSLECIHGIKSEWLQDAPTFFSVRDHIMEISGLRLDENQTSSQTEVKEDLSPKKESS